MNSIAPIKRTLLLLLTAVACSGSDGDGFNPPRPETNPPPVTRDCSTLTDVCLLPYPNSILQKADPTKATGIAISLSESTSLAGIGEDPETKLKDGFPPNTALVTKFPEGVSDMGLPTEYEDGLADDAPIQLVNADATSLDYGLPVPIYCEVFDSSESGDQLLIITPLHPLDPSSRYAAIITNGVSGREGAPLVQPEAMAALLADSAPAEDAALWEYYRDLRRIAQVERKIKPENIIQLWDFYTRSDQNITGDLVKMRNMNLAWLAQNRMAPTIVSISESGRNRRIDFTYPNPYYRTGTAGTLNRGPNGDPVMVEVQTLSGILILPPEATIDNPAHPFLFGHGLGMSGELMMSMAAAVDISTGPFALGLIDWEVHGHRGRGIEDLFLLANPENIMGFGSVFQQSAVDAIIFTEALRALNETEALNGLITQERVFYGGVSLGAIIGTIVTSIHDDIDASVLNVGGGGWANLIRFSLLGDDLGLRELVENSLIESGSSVEGLPMDLTAELMIIMAQLGFDDGDPINYGSHLIKDRFEGMNPEPPAILLQESIGDGIVPNVTSEMLARAAGLSLIEPSIVPVSGLPTATAPTQGQPAQGMTQFRVMPSGMAAHMAIGSPLLGEQIITLFDSVLDDDPANDGNIEYPVECTGPGGNCDILGE